MRTISFCTTLVMREINNQIIPLGAKLWIEPGLAYSTSFLLNAQHPWNAVTF